MANYFVDSTTGDNGNDGLTMDTAWATYQYAVESGSLVAGDIVWIRRASIEQPITSINYAYDGSFQFPIKLIGWPRNTYNITGDWTQNSTTVDNVSPSASIRRYLGRYVTAPDSNDYLVTYITDTDTIIIDRPYIGSNSVGGTGVLKADEDYDLAQAIDDSAWTIKISNWNADIQDLFTIDLGVVNGYHNLAGRSRTYFANIYFLDGNSTGGTLRLYTNSYLLKFLGCIVKNTNNRYCMKYDGQSGGASFDRMVFETGYAAWIAYSHIHFRNGAINDMNAEGIIQSYGNDVYLENVNIGVESACGSDCMILQNAAKAYGRDVKLDDTNGLINFNAGISSRASFENYNKVKDSHRTFLCLGTLDKTDVVAGSGDPEKRTNGADSVIEVAFNNTADTYQPSEDYEIPTIFTHEFETRTNNKTYRYYVQTDTETVSASQIWLEAEYTSTYSSSGAYNYSKVQSDEDIAVRTGADDWSQYLEVTNIQPAVDSKVRIKCYCRYYHATAKIWIDPKVEIL